jgi:hypothetical protein
MLVVMMIRHFLGMGGCRGSIILSRNNCQPHHGRKDGWSRLPLFLREQIGENRKDNGDGPWLESPIVQSHNKQLPIGLTEPCTNRVQTTQDCDDTKQSFPETINLSGDDDDVELVETISAATPHTAASGNEVTPVANDK